MANKMIMLQQLFLQAKAKVSVSPCPCVLFCFWRRNIIVVYEMMPAVENKNGILKLTARRFRILEKDLLMQ